MTNHSQHGSRTPLVGAGMMQIPSTRTLEALIDIADVLLVDALGRRHQGGGQDLTGDRGE